MVGAVVIVNKYFGKELIPVWISQIDRLKQEVIMIQR